MSRSPFLDDAGGPVHFMGVAGAGMIALAELLLRNGRSVTGCDLQPDQAARALRSLGGTFFQGHDPKHVDDAAVLVVTAAVPADHPEILRARERGIPILKRAEALGHWVNRGTVVAVAGSHGKTTTTAMATEILAAAGMDPTGFVGGRVESWESNLRFGGDELFVVEADEYDRSFHHLRPRVAVVTNVEADHLDIYGDLEGVYQGFRTFLEGLSPQGRLAVCGDDHGASLLLTGLEDRAITYGLNPGVQLRAVDVEPHGPGVAFQVVEEGKSQGKVTLGVPGEHNVRNALGAAAAARFLEVDWTVISQGLEAFRGVGRRFQLLGEAGGVTVVDDYAHHPSEIRATLAAARNRFPGRRIVAVFQPHLFTRTRDLAREFGAALTGADEIWITAIYPAREEPIEGVSGLLVAQAALDAGATDVTFHPELAQLPGKLQTTLRSGDVCLAMGAGSIEFLGQDVLTLLRQRAKETGGVA